MTSKPAPATMIDLAFDVSGNAPPADHPFTIWDALSNLAPALADADRAGILPMRLPEHAAEALPKRAKLTLRIPLALAEELTVALSGAQLDLGSSLLQLGMGRTRAITAYPTIHAHQVASDEDELAFMDGVRAQLDEMRIACNLICGLRHTIGDETRSIQGYSLVVHDLKAEASLKLQYAGLGEARQYGCGIFVPYKVISGLNDD
ncbi:MAG: type I-MYXAN CRISPR-associated protein Cas6/Cmx6 [Gallionella sp.]|nr:type I-MYXAN CRISPR-associated protein Cas6/Cmx6 [Gallionella sp.]MCK9352628.1 type I-MYXAN CRISPR-associated protein Cas6/Cmx6 [Gallionella sp.]